MSINRMSGCRKLRALDEVMKVFAAKVREDFEVSSELVRLSQVLAPKTAWKSLTKQPSLASIATWVPICLSNCTGAL